MTRRGQTVDAHIFPSPDPAIVATIIATKGIDAALERWHWCEKRTLMSIARSGRARTGIAPKHVSTRSHALDGREAVAVEAAFVLGSMAAVDHALDAGKNAMRSLFYKRGIDLPKGHGERVAEGCLGRRIKAGDETAVAEREAKRIHARAVCDVLAAALALVADRPATGRFRLPPADDALRGALAGLPPAAIKAVFPDLAVVDVTTPDPAEMVAPVAVQDPTPIIEAPTMSMTATDGGARRIRWPQESIIRADHAEGRPLVDLAADYGIAPSALYTRWRRYGLPGTGRLAGFVDARREVSARVRANAEAEVAAQKSAPADVPAEAVAPEPVASSHPVDPYGALSPEDAIAEVAGIEAATPLGLRHLALAVRLAAETGLTKAEAIAWVRADIHAVAAARVIPPAEDVIDKVAITNAAIADEVFWTLMMADDARSTRQ